MTNTIINHRESPIQVYRVRATPPHTFLLTKFILRSIQRFSYYNRMDKIGTAEGSGKPALSRIPAQRAETTTQ